MVIERFVSPYLQSNMYIITVDGSSVIIDPSLPDFNYTKLNVDWMILTHEHYDHICGAVKARGQTGAQIIASEKCNRGCMDAGKNMSKHFEVFCEIQQMFYVEDIPPVGTYEFSCDKTFEGEYILDWKGHKICHFELPGHSAGSIGILFDDKILFSGDSLFRDIPTCLRLPGGSRKNWVSGSITKLKKLDGNLHVYPGHYDDFELKEYILWDSSR